MLKPKLQINYNDVLKPLITDWPKEILTLLSIGKHMTLCSHPDSSTSLIARSPELVKTFLVTGIRSMKKYIFVILKIKRPIWCSAACRAARWLEWTSLRENAFCTILHRLGPLICEFKVTDEREGDGPQFKDLVDGAPETLSLDPEEMKEVR